MSPNFDIVLVARQKLDQFHSLDTAGAACRKDLDFSALICRRAPVADHQEPSLSQSLMLGCSP
jgi:hypothetical protein